MRSAVRLALALAAASCIAPNPSRADPISFGEPWASSYKSNLVATSQYQAAATRRAFERSADDATRKLRQNAERKRTEVVRLQALLATSGRDNAALKAQLDLAFANAARAQLDFTAKLAARNEEYARERDALIHSAQSFLKSDAGIRFLELVNRGDQQSWVAAKSIAERELLAKKFVLAGEYRDVALQFSNKRDLGQESTASVIARYEEVVALDPMQSSDWVALAEFYLESGSLAKAASAGQHAMDVALTDWDKIAAFEMLGAIAVERGSLTAANDCYEKARVMLGVMLAATPTDADANFELSNVLVELESIANERGRSADEERYLTKSFDLVELLAKANAQDGGVLRQLAARYQALGDADDDRGNLTRARERYQKALKIITQLIASGMDTVPTRADLSDLYMSIGEIDRQQGDTATARKNYETGRAIISKQAAQDDGYELVQLRLAVSLLKTGDAAKAQGDLDIASANYQAAFDVGRRVSTADPESVKAQSMIAAAYIALGSLAFDQGNKGIALKYYSHAYDVYWNVFERYDEGITVKINLVVLYSRIGSLYLDNNDNKGAREVYQHAMEIVEDLNRQGTTSVSLRHNFAIVQNGLGNAAMGLREFDVASRHFAAARDMVESLLNESPDSVSLRSSLAESFEKLADLAGARGLTDEALKWNNQRKGLRAAIAAIDPSSSERKQQLADAIVDIGDIYLAIDRPEEAEANYKSALSIINSLPDNNGRSYATALYMFDLRSQLGNVYFDEKKYDQALESHSAALKGMQAYSKLKLSTRGVDQNIRAGYVAIGNVLVQQQKFAQAEFSMMQALKSLRREAAETSKPQYYEIDFGNIYERLGYVNEQAGKRDVAHDYYERALASARRATAIESDAVSAKLLIATTLLEMMRIGGTPHHWSEVRNHLQSMKDQGMLGPRNQKYLEEAKAKAAAEEQLTPR